MSFMLVLCVCSQVYINKYFLLHSAIISKRLSLTTKQIRKGDATAFFILCTCDKIQTADGNMAVTAVGGGSENLEFCRERCL